MLSPRTLHCWKYWVKSRSLLPFRLQKMTLRFFLCFCSHKTSACAWSAKGNHLNLLVWSRRNSKWEKMDWYPGQQYKWERALSSSWLGSEILKQNLALLETSGEFLTRHDNTFKMIQNFKRLNMLAIRDRLLSRFSVLQTQQLDKYK